MEINKNAFTLCVAHLNRSLSEVCVLRHIIHRLQYSCVCNFCCLLCRNDNVVPARYVKPSRHFRICRGSACETGHRQTYCFKKRMRTSLTRTLLRKEYSVHCLSLLASVDRYLKVIIRLNFFNKRFV